MLLSLYENYINGTFKCVFIVCLSMSTYTGYALVYMHTIALGVRPQMLYANNHINCFAIYMISGYVHYLQYLQ